MWRCQGIPRRSGRTFFRMARTNDNRYEQSPIPFASLEASDHPARVIGAAARIRTVNPLLTKQPRCRCATAACFRHPRDPDKMALAGDAGGGKPRRSWRCARNYRYRSERGFRMTLGRAAVDCAGHQRSFQKRLAQHCATRGIVIPLRVVPCRPGRLRGTCLRVQPRAQWTVGEPFGRLGISLNPHDT